MAARPVAGSSAKKINLALQGGGAHGAFTWGVLDRLLEDGRIEIDGISGTSAGAMNAVALADGFFRDGPDGARESLQNFWAAVAKAARGSPVRRSPFDILAGNWSLDNSPGLLLLDMLSRIASPYDLNPLNINPLKDLLERQIDFACVRNCRKIELFLAATSVRTGKVKVFRTPDITVDVVMASACLPHMYQAVEIDGQAYWDGGYMGNPVLHPLIYDTACRDIVLVQINPIERKDVPRTAREIFNRVNEISFNSTLLRELRAIEFVSRLIDDNRLDTKKYKRVLLHRIGGDGALADLSASSKLNAEWEFLTHLRDLGRDAAAAWLDEHYAALGTRGTVNLREMFE